MGKMWRSLDQRPVLAAVCGCACVAAGLYLYSFFTRALLVSFGDSWIFTDMAKRLGINKSLGMVQVFDLVYPPLYSLAISPAYAVFHSEGGIFFAIRTINIALYSLVFYPIFRLLREYCGLTFKASFWGAILLAFSPCTLHYSKWVLSEAIYIPLVALLLYGVFKEKHFGSLPENILIALLLASLPLAKAVGAVPVVAFFILAAGQCAGVIASVSGKEGKWKGVAVIFAVVVLVMILKDIWYKHAIPGLASGYTNYLDAGRFPQLVDPRFWLDRIAKMSAYILIAPQTISNLFIVWLLLARRHRFLFPDPFAFMLVLCWVGHLVVVPLFTVADAAGVYHSRYLMPFMFASPLVGIRYMESFDKKSFLAVCGMLLVMFIAGWPANLHPFAPAYTDGVFLRTDIFHSPAWLLNGVYLLIMLFAAHSLYAHGKARLRMAAVVVLCMTIMGNFYQTWFNVGVSSFRGYDLGGGIGAATIGQLNGPTRPAFYVDSGWRSDSTWVQSGRVMLMVPAVPLFADFKEMKDKKNAVFLTFRKDVEGAKLIKAGNDLSLFSIY